jgi:uncharacterized damage-inducible protein DinB
MHQPFVDLLRHNLWANLRLIDVCTGLADGQLDAEAPGTYGGSRLTLVHILANEYGYAAAVRQGPPAHQFTRGDALPPLPALRDHARSSGEELIRLAAALVPDTILRGEFQGQPYEMPAAIPLMQAVNHGTEHRAHIVTILTGLGVVQPQLDMWAYWDSGEMRGA